MWSGSTVPAMTTPEEQTAPIETPVDVPPPPRRFRLIAAAAVGVVTLMAATGVTVWYIGRPAAPRAAAAAPSVPAVHTTAAAGTVTLQRGQFTWNSVADPTCQGWKGFSDLRGGTQVTITDAGGKALQIGALERGVTGGITTTDSSGLSQASMCTLAFRVEKLPLGVGPYGVEIAHRGVVHYDEDRLGLIALGF